MYGVVLWSDRRENRAVIWCEDHGDLAYFDGGNPAGQTVVTLAPGDLVRFEVSEGKRMRVVVNPTVLATEQYPTLAGDLAREVERHVASSPCQGTSNQEASSGKIVPLDLHRKVVAVSGKRFKSTG